MPNGYQLGEISASNSESDAHSSAEQHIVPFRKITYSDISRFYRLNPIWFTNDTKEENGKSIPGFSAKEIADLYPSAAVYENEDAADWSERNLIPFMVKAIQQNQKEIKELKKQIDALEKQIGKMRR